MGCCNVTERDSAVAGIYLVIDFENAMTTPCYTEEELIAHLSKMGWHRFVEQMAENSLEVWCMDSDGVPCLMVIDDFIDDIPEAVLRSLS